MLKQFETLISQNLLNPNIHIYMYMHFDYNTFTRLNNENIVKREKINKNLK